MYIRKFQMRDDDAMERNVAWSAYSTSALENI